MTETQYAISEYPDVEAVNQRLDARQGCGHGNDLQHISSRSISAQESTSRKGCGWRFHGWR